MRPNNCNIADRIVSVFEFVKDNSNCTALDVSKAVGVAPPRVRDICARLADAGFITRQKANVYRFIASGDTEAVVVFANTIKELPRQSTGREIRAFLTNSPRSSSQEIANEIGLAKSTITETMKPLIDDGAIIRDRVSLDGFKYTYVYSVATPFTGVSHIRDAGPKTLAQKITCRLWMPNHLELSA